MLWMWMQLHLFSRCCLDNTSYFHNNRIYEHCGFWSFLSSWVAVLPRKLFWLCSNMWGWFLTGTMYCKLASDWLHWNCDQMMATFVTAKLVAKICRHWNMSININQVRSCYKTPKLHGNSKNRAKYLSMMWSASFKSSRNPTPLKTPTLIAPACFFPSLHHLEAIHVYYPNAIHLSTHAYMYRLAVRQNRSFQNV